MARVLEEGKEFNGEETIIERPDGKRVTLLAHASPVHDHSGRLLGAVNVLVDITERKLAEDSQTLLAAIVQSSDDAIVSKTLDGIIRSWNAGAERVFGYTADEVIGSPITVIIPPDRHDEEREILARLAQGRVDRAFRHRAQGQGRTRDRYLADDFTDPQRGGQSRRRVEGRARHLRPQAVRASACGFAG